MLFLDSPKLAPIIVFCYYDKLIVKRVQHTEGSDPMVILFFSILIGGTCFFTVNRQLKHHESRRLPRTVAIICFITGIICMLVPFFTHELSWMLFGTPLALFGIVAIIRVQLYVN